jgi:hypothetical protein
MFPAMKDMQAHLEKLRANIAECERLQRAAKGKVKPDIFKRLVAHYRVLASDLASDLARISHSVEAHRGANQRKFFCEKDFAMIQGMPRCRQSVTQSSLILEGWKAGLWKRPLMVAW